MFDQQRESPQLRTFFVIQLTRNRSFILAAARFVTAAGWRLGQSELELHLCLVRLKNDEDWTERDYEDFGVAWDYLERLEWEERYEDFLGEEEALG